MASSERNVFQRIEEEKPTDIEVALYMVQLIESLAGDLCSHGEMDVVHYYLSMAENVIETMENPMARELLREKIEDCRRMSADR